jgi:hypothetical protein
LLIVSGGETLELTTCTGPWVIRREAEMTTRHADRSMHLDAWPALRVDDWTDTLHMWMQIVGKVRLSKAQIVNHWWNVALSDRARAEHVSHPGRDACLRHRVRLL